MNTTILLEDKRIARILKQGLKKRITTCKKLLDSDFIQSEKARTETEQELKDFQEYLKML